MGALWVVQIDVTDAERYRRYVEAATKAVAEGGGRYIARGGRYVQVEGFERTRNVVVEFDSFDDAVACYRSAAYQSIVGDAIAASDRTFVIIETDD